MHYLKAWANYVVTPLGYDYNFDLHNKRILRLEDLNIHKSVRIAEEQDMLFGMISHSREIRSVHRITKLKSITLSIEIWNEHPSGRMFRIALAGSFLSRTKKFEVGIFIQTTIKIVWKMNFEATRTNHLLLSDATMLGKLRSDFGMEFSTIKTLIVTIWERYLLNVGFAYMRQNENEIIASWNSYGMFKKVTTMTIYGTKSKIIFAPLELTEDTQWVVPSNRFNFIMIDVFSLIRHGVASYKD